MDESTTASKDDDGRAPYFFLAYAHTPQQPWVRKLYNGLCAEIMEHTTWPTDRSIGFMDESDIVAGDDWRDAVADALASCRVLVPLYSRRYFTRPECGREWHAFNRRVNEHRARHGVGPTPIVPALWTPVADPQVPQAARHVQVDFRAVHPSYANEGLYTLIKNSAYRPIYLRVLEHLTRQIIEAAETAKLTSCRVNELDLNHDAFDQPESSLSATRRLTIMVAAPTTRYRPPDRGSESYGPTPPRWMPYQPGSLLPIAQAAEFVARSLDYEPDIVSVDEGLRQRDWLSPDSGLGVVLMDPWLCMDRANVDQIQRIDELGTGRIGTTVIWNLQDPQTKARADEIRKNLQSMAPRLLGDMSPPSDMGALHVRSLKEFSAVLPGVLDRAWNRYLSYAPAQSPPGRLNAQPRLVGPRNNGRPEHGIGTDRARMDPENGRL